MTRLISEWIMRMDETIHALDKELKIKTGLNLMEIVTRASCITKEKMEEAKSNTKIGVVPITSGEGIIGSFAESVAYIVKAMDFNVFVTEAKDVAGIYEAGLNGAEIVFMADDERFIAINLRENIIGENDRATALGYVTILETMLEKRDNKKLVDKEVLLLGHGRLGREIYKILSDKKTKIKVFDKNKKTMKDLRKEEILESSQMIKSYELIIDATSEGPWLDEKMLNENGLISAPGVPFSLDEEAENKLKNQFIHDNLAVGTGVMLGLALGGKKRG